MKNRIIICFLAIVAGCGGGSGNITNNSNNPGSTGGGDNNSAPLIDESLSINIPTYRCSENANSIDSFQPSSGTVNFNENEHSGVDLESYFFPGFCQAGIQQQSLLNEYEVESVFFDFGTGLSQKDTSFSDRGYLPLILRKSPCGAWNYYQNERLGSGIYFSQLNSDSFVLDGTNNAWAMNVEPPFVGPIPFYLRFAVMPKYAKKGALINSLSEPFFKRSCLFSNAFDRLKINESSYNDVIKVDCKTTEVEGAVLFSGRSITIYLAKDVGPIFAKANVYLSHIFETQQDDMSPVIRHEEKRECRKTLFVLKSSQKI